nr:formylglycine-generating enzyme family protein [Halolactibacillus alkaliphilus]
MNENTSSMRVIKPGNYHQKGMLQLEGGAFLMGTEDSDANKSDQEGPVRTVQVAPFYIDPIPVTNQQFLEFIEDTNYLTDAERYGWSFVFYNLLSEETAKSVTQKPAHTPWWRVVEGADWTHPEGPDSSIKNRLDHPVVHISWNDAVAYCMWSGKRLLTEAEWEYAARGGLVQKRYPWGDQLTPNGKYMCNIWQGDFPVKNTQEDGYKGTCPVDAFSPNAFGIFSMVGNTWEWCANLFDYELTTSIPQENQPRAIRGGSYLCHESYCNRYRVAARSSNTPDSSSGNLGFRCAKNVPK